MFHNFALDGRWGRTIRLKWCLVNLEGMKKIKVIDSDFMWVMLLLRYL